MIERVRAARHRLDREGPSSVRVRHRVAGVQNDVVERLVHPDRERPRVVVGRQNNPQFAVEIAIGADVAVVERHIAD